MVLLDIWRATFVPLLLCSLVPIAGAWIAMVAPPALTSRQLPTKPERWIARARRWTGALMAPPSRAIRDDSVTFPTWTGARRADLLVIHHAWAVRWSLPVGLLLAALVPAVANLSLSMLAFAPAFWSRWTLVALAIVAFIFANELGVIALSRWTWTRRAGFHAAYLVATCACLDAVGAAGTDDSRRLSTLRQLEKQAWDRPFDLATPSGEYAREAWREGLGRHCRQLTKHVVRGGISKHASRRWLRTMLTVMDEVREVDGNAPAGSAVTRRKSSLSPSALLSIVIVSVFALCCVGIAIADVAENEAGVIDFPSLSDWAGLIASVLASLGIVAALIRGFLQFIVSRPSAE